MAYDGGAAAVGSAVREHHVADHRGVLHRRRRHVQGGAADVAVLLFGGPKDAFSVLAEEVGGRVNWPHGAVPGRERRHLECRFSSISRETPGSRR